MLFKVKVWKPLWVSGIPEFGRTRTKLIVFVEVWVSPGHRPGFAWGRKDGGLDFALLELSGPELDSSGQ